MLFLIDQDGVLADFEHGFHAAWQAKGYAYQALPIAERRTFYVRDDYPKHLRAEVDSIYTAQGFYLNLPPIKGATQAMSDLLVLGHDVRICTSPLNAYRYCITEKYEWVERHLGSDWVARIIVTKDKTLVQGDVLVDDKPEVTGSLTPAWHHVIFDQPYNRQVGGTRMTWENWREVLKPIPRKFC